MSELALVARPGATLGAYPERQLAEQGRIDRAWHVLHGTLRRRLPGHRHAAQRFLAQVEAASRGLEALSIEALQTQAGRLRGELRRRGLAESLVARGFALVREAATRRLGQRHRDHQIIGGWILIRGGLAEMETGEGKTLMATLAAATAALAGIPVHVVTANDYLVERDAGWMGPVFQALGLRVGVVTSALQDPRARRRAYASDVTYATSRQLAFDYLRDRLHPARGKGRVGLALSHLRAASDDAGDLLLRGLSFAIVDEADSVLIDGAGTPLILSREVPARESPAVWPEALALAGRLVPGRDYRLDRRRREAPLTESGRQRLAALPSAVLPGRRQREVLARQALAALHLYRRDRDYVVRDGRVMIVDPNTGRVLPDHSWEAGLHQLIETREGCPPSPPKETLARTSFQRFFRRYLRLAGMTGTAREVAGELWRVYDLEVVSLPPHRPMRRRDLGQRVYRKAEDKWRAVVARAQATRAAGRPVLIGTTSVADSEHLGRLLAAHEVPHAVLNARQDRDEAEVIARAGQPGAVTVATNMAGRGTDIALPAEVVARGGLHVIATQRNEAARIDRQLFGRCARQGEPGSHERLLSLEDRLLKVYLPRPLRWMARWGLAGPWLERAAQRAAERQAARQRGALLRYEAQLRRTLGFTGRME